jgi:tetratricopeptide (TPR) repeat protein
LNQENIKDKLLMKRARDEMEQTVFEILIPAANKLKDDGKVADALVEFKEALKLLTEAGWTSQTQSLRDEIADLEAVVQKKTDGKSSAKERQAVRADVFDTIIPKARQAAVDGHHPEAKQLYEKAVDKLRSIGWDEYIQPILDNIAEVDAAMEKVKAKEESITDQDRKYIAKEHIEMGMRFMSKDMKKYALAEFTKAIELLGKIGDMATQEEIKRQVKKLELELKLEESQRFLLERKRIT